MTTDHAAVTPRRTTIRDVARHAGVSTAAVSKVLRNESYGVSDELRARVETAMTELSYRPLAAARGMRGKTFTLGVLVSDIQNPFFNLLVEGMTTAIGESGYEPLLGPAGTTVASQARMVDAMIDRQMDGLVLIAPLASEDYLQQIARRVPTVVVGRHGPSDSYDTVAGDDLLGSRLIIDHLVELGHREISYVTNVGPAEADERRPELVRARGYATAMSAHGLDDHIDIIGTQWSAQGGRSAGELLRARSHKPTAVHAGADVAAFGLLSDLWEAGVQVPTEISVAGYDNTPTAAYAPISLTSVDQSGLEMGERAASLLLERVEGRKDAMHVLTTPWLARRGTTGEPSTTR